MVQAAMVHHRAGRLHDAERLYRQVLTIEQNADSLHLLGMISYQQGRFADAVASIREAVAVRDDVSSFHCNLGAALKAEGRLQEAVSAYRRSLALNPGQAEAYVNLGLVFEEQHKLDEALVCCLAAQALKPDSAEIQTNLGVVLDALGRGDEALVCYERALTLKPQHAEEHYNLGNLFSSWERHDEAIACYEQALAIRPSYAKAWNNFAHALRSLGRLDEALPFYRKASGLLPNQAEIRFGEASAQLLNGDFAQGWPGYEWRWLQEDRPKPKRVYPQPAWNGKALSSGRLLLWGEQGVGDEILFAGLLPEVLATGSRCVLDCTPRLRPLFARSFPGLQVVGSEVTADAMTELGIAAQLPAGSLPALFRSSHSAFAATTSAYLVADHAQCEQFRSASPQGRARIGVAWNTGNQKTGSRRRIDLAMFSTLFAEYPAEWISLQYGNHAELEAQADQAHAPVMVDRTVDQLVDMDRFAAQVASMDLVITIDNSTAHLAGALGVPVWVLLPFAPDWRWQLHRRDSPWYPTMRLFRQARPGDWQAIMQEVRGELVQFAANRFENKSGSV